MGARKTNAPLYRVVGSKVDDVFANSMVNSLGDPKYLINKPATACSMEISGPSKKETSKIPEAIRLVP